MAIFLKSEEIMIKLSDYIFQFLKEKGVDHAFVLPGGGAMHLDDSLGKSGMAYTCFLHEQAAAIAAEAYGQHTNRPGLLLVTSGPGATNAITGVTAGWIDSTPMFVISGQAKREDLVGDRGVRQIGSQEVPVIPMVMPVTKYAVQVLEPQAIRYHLERAYEEAVSGRPGPVWLEIPLDVQAVMIEEGKLAGYSAAGGIGQGQADGVGQGQADGCRIEGVSEEAADAGIVAAVRRTVELLKASQKPLVLAGNGVKLAGAQGKLYELLDLLHIPVQTTWKAADFFAEDDPLYVGHPGIMGDRGANLILQEADLLLSIGSRLDTSLTAFRERNFAKCAKKVIVDIDPNEIARMDMEMEASAACDAGVFLDRLLEAFKEQQMAGTVHKEQQEGQQTAGKGCHGNWQEEGAYRQQGQWQGWLTHCKKLREAYSVVTKEHEKVSGCVSAYYFISRLCSLLREDDVIVPESSGGAGEITYQAFRVKKGQKMKNAAGLGSMGFGLPYAVGACIANDKRRTVLINGDGAFQLNIQELETVHRLRLPLKIFIWSNGGYASIRAMQRNNFAGRYVASSVESGLTMPDICRVAQAYGFRTLRVRDNKELDAVLPEALADDAPLLCELIMSPEETVSPRVKAVVGENGKMESGLLEEMWPFLSRE